MLRSYYAYLERDDIDVDAHLALAREQALRAGDAVAFRRALLRATYALTDPHLLVAPLLDDDPNVVPTSSDLVIERRDERFFVGHVRAGSAAAEAGVRPGWVLTTVAGVPIEQAAVELLLGVGEGRTTRQWSYVATLVANGLRVGERRLGFLVGDEARELELANPRELAAEVTERAPLTVRRDGELVIVRFENSLGRIETVHAFDEALSSISPEATIVLDFRNTPSGGNTDVARGILGHFITETRPYQMHRIPAVERSVGVPREFVERVVPRAPHHTGSVIALGGPWTGSMGEGMVIGLHGAAGAHTIASDMGDLLGAVTGEPLGHCDAFVEFSVESLFHIDGTPRADFIADTPLEVVDLDANGEDPGLAAARRWAAAQG